jgi:hypothetical protein
MEQWDAKMGEADGADSRASMGATIDSSQRSYWTQLNSISRLPAAGDREPMLTITLYHTKPGSDAALRAVIGQIDAALEAEKFPVHTIWYVLANGGAGPTYAVVAPRAGPRGDGAEPVAPRSASETSRQARCRCRNQLVLQQHREH